MTIRTILLLAVLGGACTLTPRVAAAQHGTEPVPTDTEGLPTLGEEWRETNPYRGEALAIRIGKAAYDNNCARCHGIDAISGGIVPDLRRLTPGDEGDALFVMRVRNGSIRNGITYMPKMADVLSQEELWAIREYLESIHDPSL